MQPNIIVDSMQVNHAVAQYFVNENKNTEIKNKALNIYNAFMQQHNKATITDPKDINITLLAQLQNIDQREYEKGLQEEMNYCNRVHPPKIPSVHSAESSSQSIDIYVNPTKTSIHLQFLRWWHRLFKK